ncbi:MULTISPECIES: hypothetical protein, partial [unclassified Faecalibacterium]|uniref:hypothetical protein n=1 Tax=unclassified Faecalibacterium TaxID=2646395 RepID=UPI0019D5D1F0
MQCNTAPYIIGHGKHRPCKNRAETVQPWLTKQKSHEIFRSTASTVDIPTRWDPRAKQQQRVALADFSAAPWQGFEKSERGPNNSSLFQPQAAVVVVAVRILPIAQKESPAHESVSGILGAVKQSKSEPFSFDAAWAASSNVMV